MRIHGQLSKGCCPKVRMIGEKIFNPQERRSIFESERDEIHCVVSPLSKRDIRTSSKEKEQIPVVAVSMRSYPVDGRSLWISPEVTAGQGRAQYKPGLAKIARAAMMDFDGARIDCSQSSQAS